MAFVPLAVALGVWVLGPMAMFVSAAFTGGGFAKSDWLVALTLLTAVFPVTTFSMATYDGSLGGLLVGTLALAVLFTWKLRRSQGKV